MTEPTPDDLAAAAVAAEEFAERAEPRIWAWLNRHNAPWSPSDAKVRDLAYDLGTLAAPIVPDPMPPGLPERILEGGALGQAIADAEDRRTRPGGIDYMPEPRTDAAVFGAPSRLGRGLGALIPDALPPVTVPTPKLAAFRRSMFDWNDFGQHDDAAREAIDRVIQTLIAEDGRARSMLPDPPAGWEWHADVRSDAIGEAVLGEVSIRLVYRLREVPL